MSKIEEAIAKIDADVAKKLLERMCKAMSIAYSTKLEFRCQSNTCCFVTDGNEVVGITIASDTKPPRFYVDDVQHMLVFMLMPKTTLSFSSTKTSERLHVNTSKMFGTTLEELLVNLDLMKA